MPLVSCEYTSSDIIYPVELYASVVSSMPTVTIYNRREILPYRKANATADDFPDIVRVGLLHITGDYLKEELKEDSLIPELEKILSPTAHVCDLTWCVKNHGSAAVANGVLNEPIPVQSSIPSTLNRYQTDFGNCEKQEETYWREYEVIKGHLDRLEFLGNDIDDTNRTVLVSCSDVQAVSQETDTFLTGVNERYKYKYV